MSASSASSSDAWPDRIWKARLLSDLDARGRIDLERAGELRRVARGDTLYARGEASDVVFLLLDGTVEIERSRSSASRQATTAREGELFGVEGWVHAAAKRGETARATTTATLAALPVHVLRRSLVRAGADADADPRLVRSALREALAAILTSTGATLSPDELEALLDGVHSRVLAEGESLPGDASIASVWILEGAARDDAHHAPDAVEHARGTFVRTAGDAPRLLATEATWVACLSPPATAFVEPYISQKAPRRSLHVLDRPRVEGSRSLLVIDGDACIRCGHCVTSCADAHDDGIARFVRQGATMHAAGESALLLPGSCGHCDHAVCMVECPTGALARSDAGDVLVRADLCTGCGRCVEVCPWGNVRLADLARAVPGKASEIATLAVKCDRCTGRKGGPACVDGCPTGAIVRIAAASAEPAMVKWTDVQKRRRRATHLLALVPALLVLLLPLGVAASGGLASALLGVSWIHAFQKRRSRAAARSYVAHLAIAAAMGAAFVRHVVATASLSGAAHAWPSALAWSTSLALLSGVAGAALSFFVPARLTDLGDDGALPDAIRALQARHDERTFALLSGAGESLKALWRLELGPYAASRRGVVAGVVAGLRIAREEARLHARIQRMSEGRIEERAAAPLVSHAVLRRSRAARLVWHRILRGWIPLHVASSALSTLLTMVHVATHLLYK